MVVIERDARKADSIASEYDCVVLNADATVKETLDDAGAGAVLTVVQPRHADDRPREVGRHDPVSEFLGDR